MRGANSQRYATLTDNYPVTDNIIYLSQVSELPDYRAKLRRKRRHEASRNDTFWNLLFVVACLSVLVMLFLH